MSNSMPPNPDVIHQFLERQSAKTHTRRDNLNRPIAIKEIKSIISNFQNRKHEAQMSTLVNSTKHLKKLYQVPTISK